MFSDLDATIRRILTEEGVAAEYFAPGEIDVRFDIPDREWSSSIAKPTLNCYLFDIRENMELRQSGVQTTPANGNSAATRKRAPVRLDLTYLVTAWTRSVEDEHRLLWYALRTLLRFGVLPLQYREGDLANHTLPILTSTVRPDGVLKSPGEFWTALENQIKPSLSYVVTLALDRDDLPLGPPVSTAFLDVLPRQGGIASQQIGFGGTVRNQAGQPVAGVQLALAGHAQHTSTDQQGRYRLRVAAGRHTLVLRYADQSQHLEFEVPGPNYDITLAAGIALAQPDHS